MRTGAVKDRSSGAGARRRNPSVRDPTRRLLGRGLQRVVVETGMEGGRGEPPVTEELPDGGETHAVHDALERPGIPQRSSGNTPLSSMLGSEASSFGASGPSQIVRGPVFPRPPVGLGQRADLVPPQVDPFRQPRLGEAQQAERRQPPRMELLVPVQHRAEPPQLLLVEVSADGSSRVARDVGAGIGNVLAKLTPLPRDLEHGAQHLGRPVGGAGPARARRVELTPRVVDVPHFERSGLPAVPALVDMRREVLEYDVMDTTGRVR